MAPKILQVKRLGEVAFDVVYQQLVAEFQVIFQHEERSDVDDSKGPPAKVRRTELSYDYVLTQAERDRALYDLRQKLDENLIGPYSEERHKIVDRFVKSCSSHRPSDIDNSLCLQFFNCLLDKSFQSFNLTRGIINHPFVHIGAISLLSVISQHSPDLESLTLSF